MRKNTFRILSILLGCVFFFTMHLYKASFAQENPGFEPFSAKEHKAIQYQIGPTIDSFQVDLFTGAANYSYMIEVPPGTCNFSPNFAVTYNSGRSNGEATIVGLGWDINLSYIQRDVEFTAGDTSDDTFDLYLNGRKYDLVYIPSEDRYHTEIESFLWIKKISGSPNNQEGGYWIVRLKNGIEYRFGFNLDSENMAAERNYVWRWSIDQIKDVNDNHIYYTYQENPVSGDVGAVYPHQIQYNNDQLRKVEFGF